MFPVLKVNTLSLFQMAVITWTLRQSDPVNKIDPWSGGHKVLFAATIDHFSSHLTNTDGRATDSSFSLIGVFFTVWHTDGRCLTTGCYCIYPK